MEFILLIVGIVIGIIANHFLFRKKPLNDEQVQELWTFYANNKGGIIDIVRKIENIHGIK